MKIFQHFLKISGIMSNFKTDTLAKMSQIFLHLFLFFLVTARGFAPPPLRLLTGQ